MKKSLSNYANNQVLINYLDKNGANSGDRDFYSYGVHIAQVKDGKIYIDAKKWDYSRTTIKYLCEFLGYKNKATILDAINNGILTLKNLNKKTKTLGLL